MATIAVAARTWPAAQLVVEVGGIALGYGQAERYPLVVLPRTVMLTTTAVAPPGMPPTPATDTRRASPGASGVEYPPTPAVGPLDRVSSTRVGGTGVKL